MYWIKELQNAIAFIENNLTEDIHVEDIAASANSSSANFQRIFSIVTGMTVGDYVRVRRLSLAGQELAETEAKAIDVAIKYGYETAESFSKAFTRFHGATPSDVMRRNSIPAYFAPLIINIDIRGGFGMNRKIIPNIPDIGYYGNETDYIINLFEAAFSLSGKQTGRAEIAAYSTLGNLFAWTPGKWTWGNECLNSLDFYPHENEIRLLKNIGCTAKYIDVNRDNDGNYLNTDAEQIRRDFVDSIDKGYPVICSTGGRYVISIGYEDNGAKIINKEARDDVEGTTPNGKIANEIVEIEKWENSIINYIIIKDIFEPAPERERALNLFKHISERAHWKAAPDDTLHIGFQGWQAYIDLIENDDFANLPLTEDEVTETHYHEAKCVQERFGLYCDGLCKVWSYNDPIDYYRSLAERFPEWRKELIKAADSLHAVANSAGNVWKLGFSFSPAGYEKFRDPAERKPLAEFARRSMLNDMLAVEQFEKILAKEVLLNLTDDEKQSRETQIQQLSTLVKQSEQQAQIVQLEFIANFMEKRYPMAITAAKKCYTNAYADPLDSRIAELEHIIDSVKKSEGNIPHIHRVNRFSSGIENGNASSTGNDETLILILLGDSIPEDKFNAMIEPATTANYTFTLDITPLDSENPQKLTLPLASSWAGGKLMRFEPVHAGFIPEKGVKYDIILEIRDNSSGEHWAIITDSPHVLNDEAIKKKEI